VNEDEFRTIYQEINQDRCVFEKALNNRRCDCSQKRRFLIATREGVGCYSKEALENCTHFLDTLRKNARFSLRVVTIDGPLPHNKELQVQAGGCLALQKILYPERENYKTTDNINKLVEKALLEYASIDKFPYGEIVKGIVNYKSRRKRKRN